MPTFFFFNDTATTEIYTLSLHDALPICRAISVSRSGPTRSLADEPGEERQDDRHGDQHDDDPLEQLHALCRRPVRQFSVDAVERLQLASDADVPLRQVEATGHVAVHAGEILLTDQLQGVRHLLEQDRRVELQPPEALERNPVGTGQESA